MSDQGKSLARAYALNRAKSSGIPVKKPEFPLHTAKSIVDAIRSKKITPPEPLEDEEDDLLMLDEDLDLELEEEPVQQSQQDKRHQMLYKIMSRDR